MVASRSLWPLQEHYSVAPRGRCIENRPACRADWCRHQRATHWAMARRQREARAAMTMQQRPQRPMRWQPLPPLVTASLARPPCEIDRRRWDPPQRVLLPPPMSAAVRPAAAASDRLCTALEQRRTRPRKSPTCCLHTHERTLESPHRSELQRNTPAVAQCQRRLL